MEEDTKKKRGRPKRLDYKVFEAEFAEGEPRAAQNMCHASTTIRLLKQSYDDFFVTEKGKIRRQAIAERLGRLYNAGIISEERLRDLAKQAEEAYNNGMTVKEIEHFIRQMYKDT